MATTDRQADEHRALREGCGLLDRSERGKLALAGAGAKAFLNGQVSNDVEALTPGRGLYAALLTHKGKMLADLRVLDFEHELFLDTERVALQDLFNQIRRSLIGYDAELHKRTLERGLLSVIGPLAGAVTGAGELHGEHANRPGELAGRAVRLVVTDVGVDVVCDSADTETIASALRERGAVDVGEAAAECLRIERGRPRYGIDMDEATIPQEAGINERAVSFTKGCYVGQETVARLHYRGKPNRHLRGLRLSQPVATGTELMLGDRVVGHLGSFAVSPTLGPIGLALVRREAGPGDELTAGDADVRAHVTDLPF